MRTFKTNNFHSTNILFKYIHLIFSTLSALCIDFIGNIYYILLCVNFISLISYTLVLKHPNFSGLKIAMLYPSELSEL